jgi:hypothetical protein
VKLTSRQALKLWHEALSASVKGSVFLSEFSDQVVAASETL